MVIAHHLHDCVWALLEDEERLTRMPLSVLFIQVPEVLSVIYMQLLFVQHNAL